MSWLKSEEKYDPIGGEYEKIHICQFINEKCLIGFPECGLNEKQTEICLLCRIQGLIEVLQLGRKSFKQAG